MSMFLRFGNSGRPAGFLFLGWCAGFLKVRISWKCPHFSISGFFGKFPDFVSEGFSNKSVFGSTCGFWASVILCVELLEAG